MGLSICHRKGQHSLHRESVSQQRLGTCQCRNHTPTTSADRQPGAKHYIYCSHLRFVWRCCRHTGITGGVSDIVLFQLHSTLGCGQGMGRRLHHHRMGSAFRRYRLVYLFTKRHSMGHIGARLPPTDLYLAQPSAWHYLQTKSKLFVQPRPEHRCKHRHRDHRMQSEECAFIRGFQLHT